MAKTIDILLNVRTAQFNRGVSQANQRISSLGRTTGRVQRTMVAFAALFIARRMLSGMKEMITAAGDFQLQMIQIGRVSGIAGSELMGMRDALLELSTTMVASIDELAELAIIAGRAGINTQEGMIAIAKAASMMGNVSDLTAVQATNAFIKISKAMDLPIKDAQKLGSVIVSVAKNFAASESEIVQAMLRMAAAGNLLGATVPELVVLSAMTIELGLNARRAGMVWNRSFFQMGKNLEKAADVMKISSKELIDMLEKDFIGTVMELLQQIALIPKKVERLEKVREIFQLVGARGVALLVNRVDELSIAIDEGNIAFEEGTELVKDYELVLGSFNKQAKLLVDTFKSLKIKIADEALPAMTMGVQNLTAALKEMVQTFEEEGVRGLFNFGKRIERLRKIMFPPFRPGPQILPPPEREEKDVFLPPIEIISERADKIKEIFDRIREVSDKTAERIQKEFERAFNRITGTFGAAIAQILIMGKSSGDAFKAMWQDIASFVVRKIAEIIAKMAILLAMMAVAFAMGGPSAASNVSLIGRKLLFGFQKGGIVPGIGRGDKVPALLEPGELVVPRQDVSKVINNRFSPNVVVNMAGALILDDPNAVEKLYREGLRDRIMTDIRTGKDKFY